MIPKQDRIKPRTVEDLERMYRFNEMVSNISKATQATSAPSVQYMDEVNKKNLETANEVGNKVGKTDYDLITQMLNASKKAVNLTSDRLVLGSTQTGTGTGVVKIELFRFSHKDPVTEKDDTYSLNMTAVMVGDDSTNAGYRLEFDSFSIKPVNQE